MKRKEAAVILLILACGMLAGCTKESLSDPLGGIRFVAFSGNPGTRTSYSGEGQTTAGELEKERINWLVGDKFTVWSDKALHPDTGKTDRHTADYTVKSAQVGNVDVGGTSYPLRSVAEVEPSDKNGLRWGDDAGPYAFYAGYPAANVSFVGDPTDLSTLKLSAEIPAAQSKVNNLDGLGYAFMLASAEGVAARTEVNLEFHAQFTAFQFTVSRGENSTVTLSSFTLSSSSQPIAGPFYVSCHGGAVQARQADAKSITVDLTGVTLNATQPTYTFMVLALPQNLSNISISFTGTEIGTRTLTLKKDGSPITFTGGRKHIITGITFPQMLTAQGENTEEILWDQEAYGESIVWNQQYAEIFSLTHPTDLSYTAGTSTTASIVSYKLLEGSSTTAPLGWTIDGYFSDETCQTAISKPSWLTSITSSGTGGTTAETVTINYAAATSSTNTDLAGPVTTRLRKATPKGTSTKYWNLSNPETGGDAIIETANTYIVNAPGYYRFPLVAGNGIKNGALNTAAYSPGYFLDYKGKHFTSPYIHKTNSVSGSQPGTPTKAYVVWEEGLFLDVVEHASWVLGTPSGETSAITMSGSGSNLVYWVNFHIDKENIAQGCAVIAVKDEAGDVMWSWTIWITDYIPYNYRDYGASDLMDVECTFDAAGSKVTFMPVDLGWVKTSNSASRETVYAGNTVYVRFKQTGGTLNRTAVMRVHRPSITLMMAGSAGHAPYYQWGRKDPMIPATNATNTANEPSMVCAGGTNPTFEYVTGIGKQEVDYAIQHPEKFLDTGVTNVESSGGAQWWGNPQQSKDRAVIKSVYDPCPAGYTVPRLNAFLAFRIGTTGREANQFSYWAPKGHYMYSGYRETSSASTAGMKIIMLPTTGHRSRNLSDNVTMNTDIQEANYGFHWTSTAVTGTNNVWMCATYGTGDIIPKNSTALYRGMAIRPAREE